MNSLTIVGATISPCSQRSARNLLLEKEKI